MDHKNKSFLAKAADVTVAALVTVWILNFLLTRRFGVFLLLTFIGGFGSLLIVSGAINVVSWNIFDSDYTACDQWWLLALCWGGSAIFAFAFMAKSGMWDSVEEKCKKLEGNDED